MKSPSKKIEEKDEMVKRSDFYFSLSHLFYAMATVDNRTEPQEKKRIWDLINAHWQFKIDNSDSQTILTSHLKKLFKEKLKSEDAFVVFKNFFLQNRELFSEDLKKIILDDTTKIALSFSEINKSESVLISRLFFLMKDKE